ncbi:MAG: GNAT family N-acetyltransferase [Tissierellia bacterium]|nr:GNAT family N-acetyltransferase [Tissierellia bacterium]
MIERLRNEDFDKIYNIMEMSFPSEEYRPYDKQKALLNKPEYSIYAMYSEYKDIKAFIALWDFSEFAFIEHLAVHPEYRNCGIGAYILNELVERFSKTVCLEVELPETEIASRRIGFYKRNNFCLNQYPYMQPSISEGMKPVPMFIMTSPTEVDKDFFEHIKGTLYTKVYI